ncbi:MAG: acyl-CoA dehydrogenase [Planctomycetes bacterium RBG_16_43_13]|nr:MAG: acyl-CoA dehydrogenase [Planctomycetes bacterium RBG_16_43_13]
MDELLTKENLEWRDRARQIADEVVRPLSAKYDRAQEYPWEIKEALAKAGLLKVWIPKEFGGNAPGGVPSGGGVLNLCLVVEQLSRACGGVGVLFAVNALGSFPIILGGSNEQRKKYLPDIANGKKLIAFCLSEKFAGSDAGGMRTRARKEGSNYIIDGEKKWTTNGGVADLYTVFAVTDPASKSKRISAILVEKETTGFSIGKTEDKMGIRCVPVVETNFKGCRVPQSNLLGGEEGYGFRFAMQTLDLARPGVAAQAVGLAQGALDLALVYSAKRKQFGQSINAFQGIQHMLADMAAKVEAARYLVYAAARAADAGVTNVSKLSAECKYFATETAMEVTTKAVQIFGGYGYMKDYPIEKYMRDAKITQIYEGANEIQKLVIARNLIKEGTQLSHLEKYIPTETQYALEE